ncbi:MAG TPA: hypothetical protein VGI10_14270 [Polyangiaceae bacterium]|jgi:hypothetical protein
MDDERLVAVSPRHSVLLSQEYLSFVDRAPRRDYVVRTLAKRQIGNMTLMSGDLVIASEDTRAEFPLAARYPLHFRKAYFPGQMHDDPSVEFELHTAASTLISVPPPIGHTPNTFRSCLLPGRPYEKLSPFGLEPEEANIAEAEKLSLAAAAGLFRLVEEAFGHVLALHSGGLAHGDLELHNLIVCSTPLEILPIDFETAVRREGVTEETWNERCAADRRLLLREALFLQCTLGRQENAIAEYCEAELDTLVKSPKRFRKAIMQRSNMSA